MNDSNIVLVGFMGTGKSSVGRLISAMLAYEFVDTDELIAKRAGAPVSEIFAEQGEETFRDLETEVLSSLSGDRRRVIATGGGAVLREENRSILRDLGFVALLTASEDVIYRRVRRSTHRPLLRTSNPREVIRKRLRERTPLYQAAAHWSFDTTDIPRDVVAEAVLTAEAEHFA